MQARAVVLGLALAPLVAGCGSGDKVPAAGAGQAVGAPPAAVGPRAQEEATVPAPEVPAS